MSELGPWSTSLDTDTMLSFKDLLQASLDWKILPLYRRGKMGRLSNGRYCPNIFGFSLVIPIFSDGLYMIKIGKPINLWVFMDLVNMDMGMDGPNKKNF